MTILELSGKRVEFNEQEFSQNLQVNDLAEVQDRQANYTNQFTLPFTPVNIAVMDQLGIAGNKSNVPFSRITAKLIVDGIELISDGYAQVTESNPGYMVTIYDGNITLLEVLKGKRINDLDLSDLNHTLNELTYINSFSNTSGYIYGLGAFGVKNPSGAIRVDYQAPSVFLHTIWDRMFNAIGFEYEGDLFDSTDFKSELIAPAGGYELNDTSAVVDDLLEADASVARSNYALVTDQQFTDPFNFTYTINEPTKISSSAASEFTVLFDGRLRLNLEYTLQIVTGYAFIRIKKNGTNILVITQTTGSTPVPLVLVLPVLIGDVITMVAESDTDFTGDPENPDPGDSYEIDFTSDISFSGFEIQGGQAIDFANTLPDAFQIDLVKDVMQRYGLIYRKIRNSNTFEFIQLEDLLNDRAGAEEWSGKIVGLGSEKYAFGSYAQENQMKYVYDEGIQSFDQNGTLEINNTLLREEKTLFTSISKIRKKALGKLGNPVYLIPLWEEIEEDEVVTVVPRSTDLSIFRLQEINITTGYQFFENGAVISFIGNVPFLSYSDMSYQYFIDTYYPAFARMLAKPRKRTDVFLLSVIDIYNIDFFKLKYIKQLGQYYYLNKVLNFQNGKPTSCELVQVNFE